MIIGSHVSMSGKDMLLASVNEALGYQASAFMVYTGAPQNTRRKAIEDMKIEEAHDLMKEHGLDQKHIVVHAPYIMNFSNKDSDKRAFAVDFFTEEVKRTAAMGARQIVLHPGAHVSLGADLAIQYIIEGLNEVIERTKDLQVLIALETMAGKGTEIGRNFDELKAIIEGVSDSNRLSVCFDTCHTHDAGYSVKEDFDAVMREFDQKIGTDKISVFHINDSKNVCGASKDRHENIGFGYIGYEALHYIVHHSDFQDIPKILETPYITECDDTTKKVFPPYKEEIEMLQNHIFNPDIKSLIRKRYQR